MVAYVQKVGEEQAGNTPLMAVTEESDLLDLTSLHRKVLTAGDGIELDLALYFTTEAVQAGAAPVASCSTGRRPTVELLDRGFIAPPP